MLWIIEIVVYNRTVIARSKATWQSPKVLDTGFRSVPPNIWGIATPVCGLVRNDIKPVNNNLTHKGGSHGPTNIDPVNKSGVAPDFY